MGAPEWSTGRRRLLGVAGATAILLLSAACSGSHPTPSAGDLEGMRDFHLADGRMLAVGSSDQHDLVARWRSSAGTWSTPRVVFRDEHLLRVSGLRVAVGGSTLALFATWTPPSSLDPDEVSAEELQADDVTVAVVCSGGRCTTSPEYAGTPRRRPQVTPDGRHALVAVLKDGYVGWHDGAITKRMQTGLPEAAYGDDQPLLAPDGSLRAVSGVSTPGGCSFTLHTTAPGKAAFTAAADPVYQSGPGTTCASTVDSFASDYVVVSRAGHPSWYLVRDADGWHRVARDPSGQVHYPRSTTSKLAGRSALSGYWHWRQVLASSPDGRTLVAQLHRPGERTWGPPKVVVRAPAGVDCWDIEPMPTYPTGEEDPFYLNLRCRSRAADGSTTYTYPTAVTDDGTTWHSFLATDTGVRVGRDLVFDGHPGHYWSPGSGLTTVRLPVPDGAHLSLLSNHTFALSSLVPAAHGCRVQVQLAGLDDTTWSDPVPSTALPVPHSTCSFASVSADGRSIFLGLGRPDQASTRQVRMLWHDGHAQLEDSPR